MPARTAITICRVISKDASIGLLMANNFWGNGSQKLFSL
ncbi:hypothetical protein CWATWH8502_1900 [Crocosphaera watsonii WH 8502]|uniref:Uncharacterized protein n=1 Tax=Crocosphaera watsonii WH 8502 TaxID=423474 RepID=T2IDJ1_CROWT|nr:hypothetical protein CWATWH8502_1900 [Crocosphaera watsonii WH 8502]